MADLIEDLRQNFLEFYDLAEDAFQKKKFNGAVTLYYKALVELCDYVLFKAIKMVGANHTERFELLQRHEPALYEISRKLFRFYRDSYNKRISPAIAQQVQHYVRTAKNQILTEKKD